MKRVVIFTNHSFMLWQFRRERIQSMLGSGMEVIIGVPFGDRIEDFQKLGCRMINTPLERRGINPFRDFKLLRQYFRILRAAKPDMVVTYSIKPNIYAGWACRCLRIPYCVNVQGLGTAFQKPFMARIVTIMYHVALKRAKVIFFENIKNAELFRERKISTAKQEVILRGAGINLDHYPLQPYPRNDTIRFLYVGRLMKEKGIEELFSAAKMLYDDCYDICLDLVGFFEDSYKEQIQVLCDAGIAHFHGFQDDPRPFYANEDCVVLPSYHEGMSNVLLEGAASGRPIITSYIPGCREAVDQGVSGFTCRTRNKYGLYEAMRKVASMTREQREEMGLEGRQRMEEFFDKNLVVEQTMNAIFES